jgi:16S rRNA (uracil1498-N3)-methyltransferase
MSRFYVPPECVRGDRIYAGGDEAHHIINVMRMKEGETVVVFDNTSAEYIGSIEKIDKKELIVEISIKHIDRTRFDKGNNVILAQAIPKNKKMQFIVEKSTELGLTCLLPMVTDRTIVRPSRNVEKKLQRWRKISAGAAKQSGRVTVPSIPGIFNFDEVLARLKDMDLAVCACFSEDTTPLRDILNEAGYNSSPLTVMLMVGPEGGFSEDEIARLPRNCRKASLGKRTLKSDTAGLYMLAALDIFLS